MPDFRTHLIGGGIVGFGVFLFSGIDINLFEIIFLVGLSVFGAMIPDKLEPAISGDHRSFFHSWLVLVILASITLIMLKNAGDLNNNTLAGFFLVGYISHLLLDLSTPNRLPLIV